jgi:outer membrane lipoprotein SlyB
MTDATTPLAAQAEAKHEAKLIADAKVATLPEALHHIKMEVGSPPVLASTAVGAILGAPLGGPVGSLVGAGIGFLVERYHVASGPVGRAYHWLRERL